MVRVSLVKCHRGARAVKNEERRRDKATRHGESPPLLQLPLPLPPPPRRTRAGLAAGRAPGGAAPRRRLGGFVGGGGGGRGVRLVARAGPSASSYVFAFVFPLSLLVVTVFASIKIADKLDRDFLEELAINQAIKDADEGDDAEVSLEEKPVLSRTRNRPKREA
ncbi:uncharacterized protein LOC115684809 [Syzygium oleosum]|uniref:uncharacterized protein LOC115684809 n=1 Tax=Syzygium oleosum TaxID=219896 RepID=UPI0024B91020|nr:uncharacterized protein LOC115684809 [Syzygium oleosum]